MIEWDKWAWWLRGVAREILLKLKEIDLVPAEIHICYTPVICVHTTFEFSLSPTAGGQVLPSTSSHLPSCQFLPWQESHTTERVCNTVRYFSHPLCAEENTGDLAKEVRYVWTQNKDTFYCTPPHTVLYTKWERSLTPASEWTLI